MFQAICILIIALFAAVIEIRFLPWYYERTRAKALDNGLLVEFDCAFRDRARPGPWTIVLREVGLRGIQLAYKRAEEIKRNNEPMVTDQEWLAGHEKRWHAEHGR